MSGNLGYGGGIQGTPRFGASDQALYKFNELVRGEHFKIRSASQVENRLALKVVEKPKPNTFVECEIMQISAGLRDIRPR